MRWFRSHSKGGACAALLGLALQLALSFGHIHLEHVLDEGHSSTAASPVAASLDGGGAGAIPADRETPVHENEYCPIYAINSLIGSAAHIEPPALLLPLSVIGVRFPAARGFELAQSRHILQRARAPPIA